MELNTKKMEKQNKTREKPNLNIEDLIGGINGLMCIKNDTQWKPLSKDEFIDRAIDVYMSCVIDSTGKYDEMKRDSNYSTACMLHVISNNEKVPVIYQTHNQRQFPMGNGIATIGFGTPTATGSYPVRRLHEMKGVDFLNLIEGKNSFYRGKNLDKYDLGKDSVSNGLILTKYFQDLNEDKRSYETTFKEGLDLHLKRVHKLGQKFNPVSEGGVE
jgi:hypothetical protein